ncbi:MAG: PASTA domain-containing protein [Oscillospiraceae bacterium]|nr:PASTA domain-containing protein [Oscillospiraceae bacterium]
MAGRMEERQRRERTSKQLIFRRTVCLMIIFGVLSFIPLGWKLWDIAIVHHEEYQMRQLNQSTRDVEVRSNRGTIRDTSGNVLAMSATVYNLILSPLDLINSIDQRKFKNEDGVLDEAAYNAAIQARRDLITDKICSVLELDRESVTKRMERTNSQYEIVKKNIEGDQAEQLQAFIAENKLGYSLIMTPTTKRYYPFSSVASHVVGFVNDNGGAYGVEAAYEDVLEGTSGRVVTSKTGAGTEIYNSYSDYIDAVDGNDITLTIDTSIQRMAEQTLAAGIEKYEVQNGGICVVMNPKTGAVLAMASAPNYDLNSYGTIHDPTLNAQAAAQTEREYQSLRGQGLKDKEGKPLTDEQLRKQAGNTAVGAALNKQWRSKVLNDTYEPGSTFKSVVLAAALEAGVVSDKDHFFCPGFYVVNGRSIACSERKGHGDQTLAEAVQNSCNPAFMMIGQKLGAEKFYDYYEAFGLKEETGIDLPGEAKGQTWGRDFFTSAEGYLSLATASFGQRFTVSPLQLLSAFSATINGGYLMQPYVLQSISDSQGTIIRQTEPTVVRQVVSEQTSRHAAEILESVVSEGTGRNAYVAGYRIGGKTGTAEGEVGVYDEEIVSFVGFAPANDPQVIALLYFDTPKHASPRSKYGSTGYYISGGQMAAPLAGQLIANVLDYLGVERQYTQAEAAAADVSVPKVTGYDLDTARAALKRKNLTCRTVGTGTTVTGQIPAVGASIPGNSTVILYMGEEAPADQVIVPDLKGLTYDQAKKKLNELGLYLRASGVSYYSAATKALDQSVGAGETVDRGTVVPVRFVDTSVTDAYTPLE